MRIDRRALIAPFAAAALVVLAPREARADGVQLGAGVGVAVPVSKEGYDPGLAVDGRLGYELSFGPVALTPEVTGGYTSIAVDEAAFPGVDSAHIARAMAGARLGIGKLVVPFAAVHAGYGWLSQGYGLGTFHDGGFTFDAKVGFDVRPLRFFSVGAILGYNVLLTNGLSVMASGAPAATPASYDVGGALDYLSFGLEAALTF
jgi:hypothetical protein